MTPIAIIAWVALAQWLVFALLSLVARGEEGEMRRSEKHLLGSTVAFAAVWITVLALGLPPKEAKAETEKAAVTGGSSGGGNCISVERGMSAADVDKKAGKPDETRNDEETRGPGAKIRIYREARCSVHMLGDKVEFVD